VEWGTMVTQAAAVAAEPGMGNLHRRFASLRHAHAGDKHADQSKPHAKY
jgi:hypothetical protein